MLELFAILKPSIFKYHMVKTFEKLRPDGNVSYRMPPDGCFYLVEKT